MRCLLTLVAVLVLASACGGGGGGGSPGLMTIQINSDAAVDGDAASFGIIRRGTPYLQVGDLQDDSHARAFLAFDLSTLPSQGTLVSVELILPLATPYAISPWPLGDIHIDHVEIGADGITLAHYDGHAIALSVGRVSGSSVDIGDPAIIDVTARVVQDLTDGRWLSSFRLRAADTTNGDGIADIVVVPTADAPEQPAWLRVTYAP